MSRKGDARWRARPLRKSADFVDWGWRSCAHWLNWRTGLDLGAAREKLRVAGALADLNHIAAAMARVGDPDTASVQVMRGGYLRIVSTSCRRSSMSYGAVTFLARA